MKIQYGKQSTFEVTFQAFKVYIRYKENVFSSVATSMSVNFTLFLILSN